MKCSPLYLSVGLVACAASFASADHGMTKDEQKLEETSSRLDKDSPSDVESRLKTEYKVDDARIQGLRGQKMGYGEISIALALAEKMPGGITDANVKAVMDLRNGPPKMGWGQVAKKQGTTIGKVNGKVQRVEGSAGRKADKAARPEKAAKHEKHEKPEKAEKAEKPERAEKASHGKH